MSLFFQRYRKPFNAVLLSVSIALIGYIAVCIYAGRRDVAHIMEKVGFTGLAVALVLSLCNYGLRFIRWQMYLQQTGHHVPIKDNLSVYFSGFAFTATPGKAGEAIRSLFLKEHGVPVPTSLAMLVSERFSDLIAVVLLSGLGLFHYPQARLPVFITAGLIIVFQLLILYRPLPEKIHTIGQRREHAAWFTHIAAMLEQIQRCNTPTLILSATLISVVSWGAEALAFYLLIHWTGTDLSFTYAVFVYAVSMLAGALTFLPGGLGGAEGAMISLLLLKGVNTPSAVALTIFIRLTTLWFAVLLGILALYRYRLGRRHES